MTCKPNPLPQAFSFQSVPSSNVQHSAIAQLLEACRSAVAHLLISFSPPVNRRTIFSTVTATQCLFAGSRLKRSASWVTGRQPWDRSQRRPTSGQWNCVKGCCAWKIKKTHQSMISFRTTETTGMRRVRAMDANSIHSSNRCTENTVLAEGGIVHIFPTRAASKTCGWWNTKRPVFVMPENNFKDSRLFPRQVVWCGPVGVCAVWNVALCRSQ